MTVLPVSQWGKSFCSSKKEPTCRVNWEYVYFGEDFNGLAQKTSLKTNSAKCKILAIGTYVFNDSICVLTHTVIALSRGVELVVVLEGALKGLNRRQQTFSFFSTGMDKMKPKVRVNNAMDNIVLRKMNTCTK